MKREGGAAVLERPRAGECLRGVLGLGLAPWGRAVGPGGEGVLGAREGGGGSRLGGGAEARRDLPVCPSAGPSLAPFLHTLLIHSFFLPLLIAAGCPALL